MAARRFVLLLSQNSVIHNVPTLSPTRHRAPGVGTVVAAAAAINQSFLIANERASLRRPIRQRGGFSSADEPRSNNLASAAGRFNRCPA